MKITSKGKPIEVTYAIKGSRMRMETEMERGKSVTSIMDLNAKEIIMLVPDQKMYMVMPMKDAVEAARQASAQSGQSILEKTSETEKILGYTATKYLAKSEGGEPIEIWAASGIGFFFNPNSLGGPMGNRRQAAPAAWERELREKGFFPLRTVVRSPRGDTRMEVVALEKEKLADTLFQPPADYQKFSLPGGLGGFLPGGRN